MTIFSKFHSTFLLKRTATPLKNFWWNLIICLLPSLEVSAKKQSLEWYFCVFCKNVENIIFPVIHVSYAMNNCEKLLLILTLSSRYLGNCHDDVFTVVLSAWLIMQSQNTSRRKSIWEHWDKTPNISSLFYFTSIS